MSSSVVESVADDSFPHTVPQHPGPGQATSNPSVKVNRHLNAIQVAPALHLPEADTVPLWPKAWRLNTSRQPKHLVQDGDLLVVPRFSARKAKGCIEKIKARKRIKTNTSGLILDIARFAFWIAVKHACTKGMTAPDCE